MRDAIPQGAVHLCVDMQRLFAEDTPWRTPWMQRVAPVVAMMCDHRPAQTVFTRFVPPSGPDEARRAWRPYWERWSAMTLRELGADYVELMPELARFTPPALVFDKRVYSPWWNGRLHQGLQARSVDTLIVTGGETDVCVLATVLGAVDLGYRVIVAADALCSSADADHDAALQLYSERFGVQIETAPTAEIISGWE
ncbi:cysteine hydrolase family protein [Brevundimonas lutea]|uniref:cysteine hydrolase family protein n=1 Tax=Brevundimonas lutea TaxID=2293980 RepID=UPI001F0B7513|nr:cysteine hydrolase [Brevundimonas lutea]